MNKKLEDQVMRLTNRAADIAIEAHRPEYSAEVKQRLILAVKKIEEAISLVRVPSK